MRSINKYKYLLILLVIIISIIFINFFKNGIIKEELTSNFISLFYINNIEIIGRERSSKKILSEVLKPYENKSLVSMNLKNIQKGYLMIIEKIIYGQNSTYLKVN